MAYTQPTLLELQTEARQLADQVNSDFVTEAELTGYINKSWAKVYDLMVTTYGENYYVNGSEFTFTTDGVNEMFDLPTGFYKSLGVDLCLSGNSPSNPNNWLTLWPFTFAARNRSSISPAAGSVVAPTDYRYRIHGDQLWLNPVVMSGCTVRLWYVPTLTPLVNASDQTSFLQPGWDELITVDTAIKMVAKSEQDTTDLKTLKAETIARLSAAASNRDAGAPAQVVDVYGPGTGGGDGDWGTYGIWY